MLLFMPSNLCPNQNLDCNKLAARSKTSMGWFYGFKLHLVVSEHGDSLRNPMK